MYSLVTKAQSSISPLLLPFVVQLKSCGEMLLVILDGLVRVSEGVVTVTERTEGSCLI